MAGAMSAGAAGGMGQATYGAPPMMHVEVDVRDIAKRLITSTVTIDNITSGTLDLWYPKFIPGNHSASGPIHNVGGLRVRDAQGNTLMWQRDAIEPRHITVEVPAQSSSVQIETIYITNQPSAISRSSDSYGFSTFGAINWNAVLWYPGNTNLGDVRAHASVILPKDWRGVGAGFDQTGATLARNDVPIMELVDTPVVFGEFIETHALDAPHGRKHFVHSVGHDAMRSALPEWMLPRMNAMLAEAEHIFGPFRREDYHFLILCDNTLRFGLEHGRSTFVSAGTNELLEAAEEPEDGAVEAGMVGLTVLPHEYIHAWNGKLASPAGILRNDYHAPLDGSLLWVYEGLTTYYTDVLAARAGMISSQEFEYRLTNTIDRYTLQDGRLWRSIEDTARDVEHVRVPSPNWEDLRRRADYYGEGALFWMEADAIIRRGSAGELSLDDFCRAFFDVPVLPVSQHHSYMRDDIVRTLRDIWPEEDWDALIRERIELPTKSLIYERLLKELGRMLVHTSQRSALQRRADRRDTGIDLRSSVGFSANPEGTVVAVRRGSPADVGGLAHEMKLLAVDDVVFSTNALRQQVAATPETSKLRLLVAQHDRVQEISITYGRGIMYPHLKQTKGEPNILQAIIAPRAH